MSTFAFCRPDFKNGVVWCQHFNGSWAPPFPMQDWDAKKSVVVKEKTASTPEEKKRS